MLSYCVGERVSVEVVLRYGSCILVKMPCFGCKAPMWWVDIRKKGSPVQWGDLFSLGMVLEVRLYLDLVVVQGTYQFHGASAKHRNSIWRFNSRHEKYLLTSS